jgi:signal transduction histidine kinase
MPTGDEKSRSARRKTDASLQSERRKTDWELDDKQTAARGEADTVLHESRVRADVVLQRARDRADAKSPDGATSQLRDDRSREDEIIAKERRVADAKLEADRVGRHIVLASLLIDERRMTDVRLLAERAQTDEILAHRDDFLAMLAHDLRNLLGSIALNASLLEAQGQRDPIGAIRWAASIQRTTAQMARLIADLLDVATLDAGKLVLLKEQRDAVLVVRQAAEAFAPTASSREVTVSVDVPDGELIGSLDPDRIAQVLGNLLGNAAKFTHPGGHVTIGVMRSGQDLRFLVRDTGEGIPPEKLETIFDRYAQIGRADRRGLGLGLYISRRIVEAHGGRLWAESIVGQGSTFFVTVPASREAPTR